MKDMTRATFLKLTGAAIALTLLISVVMVNIDWLGMDGSVEKGPIITLLNVMIVLSALVFAVVLVMMVYAIWKYRAKPGDESDGEPIHGNTRLEIIWTVIPTIIVIFGGIYSTIVLNDIEAEAANQMEVDVTAQQFAWRFDYPEQGVSSTELHVPSGTQLELHLNALDVLHSFWVPEWAIKRDLVPGSDLPGGDEIDNVVRVTPDVEGTYSVICTELCGWGHSTMRAAAVVESQQEFDEWVKTQPKIPEGQVSTGAAGGQGAGVYSDEVTE
ncbi:MAG TPA: cytochrome c oxidase subunit II [Solirubrobacterales bacterium]|nr:cytochrome c oxidase subunit II [Solirubrobacterales bacterium]